MVLGGTNVTVLGESKVVVTLGVSNVISVHTDDAILIMEKGYSKDISSIVDKLIDMDWI